MERLKVAIVGSGPGGLSAAARAAKLGLSHVLLEREPKHADTIQKYARGKFVMATPDILPRRSDMSFEASSRESVLDTWAEEIKSTGLNIRYGATVTAVRGRKGAFTLTLAEGGTVEAEHVILAIGLQGNLRRLGVPGDEPPMVQYQLDDPKAYAEQSIVVIGAGDAAIENAIALAEQNQVTIVNRQPEFARAKTGNLIAIEKAIRSGLAAMRLSGLAGEGRGPVDRAQDARRHRRTILAISCSPASAPTRRASSWNPAASNCPRAAPATRR